MLLQHTVPVVLGVIFEIADDDKKLLLVAGVDLTLDESELLVPGKNRVSVLPLLKPGVDGGETLLEETGIGLLCVAGGGVEDGTL